ncbi:hypothetical protein V2J09_000865 [Rumex salicifolius]
MADIGSVNIGGKGSSLTPTSVFSVANNLAGVQLDSAALEKLSSSSSSAADQTYHITFPEFLTVEQRRASLVVILNKLLQSSSNGIRPQLPDLISQILNDTSSDVACSCSLEPPLITHEEKALLDSCLDTLDGICAVLDHETSSLSSIADLVAALSCEASRANISAFNDLDSGDGFTLKDEASVASDLKVLLNGSKLVGKNDVSGVSCIPSVHGALREELRKVHSRARVKVNSADKDGGLRGTKEAWLISLLVSEVAHSEEYAKFLHLAYDLVKLVRAIVSWEMAMAVLSLESAELLREGVVSKVDVNGGNPNPGKKGEKKKKKVLGKGTDAVMIAIKERLLCTSVDGLDDFARLTKFAECFPSILSPKDEAFGDFVQKIKDLLESNESRRLPKIPKGTRDFSKEQMAVRESAFAAITDCFKRHGAMALDTPAFELKETLTGKYGEDSKLIYDLADQGGELCSLRYDLTVPFARFVAMNGLTSYKRYQIAKVYRRDNPSKGRYREFYQCDFDIAGQHEKMAADFEIVKILTELLDELNIGDYEVKLNHRKLLDGMLDICGVPPEKFRTICSSIDKLDKLSLDQVKKEMVHEKGLSIETADKIEEFVTLKGHPLELLSKLKQDGSKFLENNDSVIALNELDILFKALDRSKCIHRVVFDLSLARGLDYYTGVIFEAVFKGSTQVGSIAAGGRYDNLISMFGGKPVPAVGVSLGIERVYAIMEQQIKDDKDKFIRGSETQVLVSILGDDLSLAAELASELWSARIKTEFMVHKKVMKHIDRAKDDKIPFMVIVGEREMKEGIVKVKDIELQVEEAVPRNMMVEELKRRLSLKS